MQKLVFILPARDTDPCGGYKIVYEYANRLIKYNYEIHILYPQIKRISELKPYSQKYNKIILLLKKIKFFILKNQKLLKAAEWFNLDKNVKKDFCYEINNKVLKKYGQDCCFIATAISTAYLLNKCDIPQNRAYYLIQDLEQWYGITEEQVFESLRFPFNKIVISNWLKENVIQACKSDKNLVLIPNGIDFDYFKLINEIETRKNTEIAMLYHLSERKRCSDSIAALKIVHEKVPDLHVTMFGTPEKPNDIPEYFDYYQMPDKTTHNKIYNQAAIFIAASNLEGFGLPPAEAMTCGCALCCTATSGFLDFAKNNITALTSPVYDVNALAENILKLINDNSLRIRIAKAGNEYIKQFSWDKAVTAFNNFLESKKLEN